MPKLKCFSSYLQLSLCNIFKPSVKWRMKMQLEKSRQAMLQLHLSDQQSIAYYNATYIRDLRVSLFYHTAHIQYIYKSHYWIFWVSAGTMLTTPQDDSRNFHLFMSHKVYYRDSQHLAFINIWHIFMGAGSHLLIGTPNCHWIVTSWIM